jgi:endo-1,4-beta-xylanase
MRQLYRLGAAVVLAAFAGCSGIHAQTLRDLAAQRGIHIGSAADPSFFTESGYNTTLGREFNQLEPENDMKFGPIHPGVSTYSFTRADQLVSYAQDHNMSVRGHTLVWYQQNPSWLTNGGYNSQQLSSILQDHIKTVVGRYAGKVYAWDVVNEAFNDDGTIRSTIWSDSPGIGLKGSAYIEQALRWAHQADPNAKLFYNDYSNASISAKSDAIYKMAQDFLSRGVPLNGIGLQMHLTNANTDLSGIEPNIKRLTDLGLEVQYTELDVRLPVDSSGNATSAMLATEAQIYQSAVTICLKYRLCTAVQTWGFTDKHSWIPGTYPGFGAALEFDANYQPKPAYTSMLSALQNSPPVISADGMTNAASYDNSAVAPGEIVVLFGPTYGPATLQIAQADASNRMPTQLGGTRLWFDGVAAPLIYSEVGQMSAVAPYGIAGKGSTQLQYEYQGIKSNAITMKVAPVLPAVFTLDSTGSGPAAILDVGYHVVNQSNPAHTGDTIQIFGTGAGVTNPATADGLLVLSTPLPQIAAKATIGGVDCPVSYAGAAYGLVGGVLQVNVVVPAGVQSGEQPVVVTIGGVPSQQAATVWVK